MIKKIKSIFFEYTEIKDVYQEYRNEIIIYWKELSKVQSDLFDGNVITVLKIETQDDIYRLKIGKIKFSDVAYAQNIGKIKTRTLFCGGYIITNDGYICLALNRKNILNLIGGMASLEDFNNHRYNSKKNLIREFKEEIGINLSSNEFEVDLNYIKYPDKTEDAKNHYSVGIIYEIKTILNKNDIIKKFNFSKRDDELKDLIFFNSKNLDSIVQYNKKDYLDELIKLIVINKENL